MADCERCRTVLSNLVALNSETVDEVAAAAPVTASKVVTPTEIPWYQKLFAPRNLAFGMGALALIFAVGIVFVVVQNVTNSGQQEMAKSTNQDTFTENDKADSELLPNDDGGSDLNTNSSSRLEDQLKLDEPISQNDAKEKVTNGTSAPTDRVAEKVEPASPKQEADLKQPLAKSAPKLEARKSDKENESDGVRNKVSRRDADKAVALDSVEISETKDDSFNDLEEKPAASPKKPSPITTRGRSTKAKKRSTRKAREESPGSRTLGANKPFASKRVNGKNFVKKNNVWIDSAYKGNRTTNIKRNTKDFGKLDSGLRSIANNLSGTVIVVWKKKAYKIQ